VRCGYDADLSLKEALKFLVSLAKEKKKEEEHHQGKILGLLFDVRDC